MHFTAGMPPGWTATPVRHSENLAGIPTYAVHDAHRQSIGAFCPDSFIPEDAHKRYFWQRFNQEKRMHILDAIKALKGGLESEKEAHLVTMTERDEARDALQPTKDAREAAEQRAVAAEAELAAAAQELGVEYPAAEEEAPAKK